MRAAGEVTRAQSRSRAALGLFRRALLALAAAALFASAASLASCAPEPRVPDADISREVTAALEVLKSQWDPRLFVVDVAAEVSQGVVTLSGDVDGSKHAELLAKVEAIPGTRRVVDELRQLPDPALGGETEGIVSVAVANLGDGPGQDLGEHLVTQARLGDPLEVLLERDGWFLVRMTDDGYLGWLGPDSFARVTAAEREAYLAGEQALVTSKFAAIHEAPRAGGGENQSAVLLTAVMGTMLPLAAEADSGDTSSGGAAAGGAAADVAVRLPSGQVGYVGAADVRLLDSAVAVFASQGTAEDIIALAESYRGLPYLWGGTTSYGFDCSGFVQFVFGFCGYRLPRDADMQYGVGAAVESRSELRPGDLVFWSTYKAGPSHVGIYIGDGRYIQSGGSSGVAVYSLDPAAPDYSETLDHAYIGARRILGTGQ